MWWSAWKRTKTVGIPAPQSRTNALHERPTHDDLRDRHEVVVVGATEGVDHGSLHTGRDPLLNSSLLPLRTRRRVQHAKTASPQERVKVMAWIAPLTSPGPTRRACPTGAPRRRGRGPDGASSQPASRRTMWPSCVSYAARNSSLEGSSPVSWRAMWGRIVGAATAPMRASSTWPGSKSAASCPAA